VVLRHDAALAGLLREVVDFGESSGLVVEAGEAETFVLGHTVGTLGGATDCHAEALSFTVSLLQCACLRLCNYVLAERSE
jgi:hypothetical protein